MQLKVLGFDLNNILKRSTGSNRPKDPLDDRWYMPFNYNKPSASGVVVNPQTAMMNPTVYACVKVISESLASIPLILYKRTGEREKKRASDHPLYRVLKTRPNPRLTSMEFREMLTGHYLLRGNGYAQIIRNGGSDVLELWPLHPDRMHPYVDEDTGVIVYEYEKLNGQTINFKQEEIFHLRGPTDNGVVGKAPLDYFKEAVGLGLAMESYLANFYSNNASPSGVLQVKADSHMSQKAISNLKDSWVKKFGGTYNSGGVAVLEEGVEWKQVGMTATDAQLTDTRKDQIIDIARCFRMPLHKIGMMDKATFSNIEYQAIEFLTDTMMPHLVRWEQAIDRDLLEGEKPDKYFPEFMVDGLLRGDIKGRYGAYAVARQWGWMSVNDIRAKENENPVEGGDVYLQPLNMIEAKEATDYLLKANENDEKQPGTKDPTDDNSKDTLKNYLTQINEERQKSVVSELKGQIDALANQVKELKNQPKVLEIEPKIPKIPEKLDKISDPSFFRVRVAANEMFAESIERVLKREETAVFNARKKNTPELLERDFYPDHQTFTRDRLRTSVMNYLEQVRLFANHHERRTIGDVLVPKACEQVLNQFVETYYAKYKDAGERIGEVTKELSTILTQLVERAATSSLISCNTPEEDRSLPHVLVEPNVTVRVEQPRRPNSWEVTMDLDPQTGRRKYKIEDLSKEE